MTDLQRSEIPKEDKLSHFGQKVFHRLASPAHTPWLKSGVISLTILGDAVGDGAVEAVVGVGGLEAGDLRAGRLLLADGEPVGAGRHEGGRVVVGVRHLWTGGGPVDFKVYPTWKNKKDHD